jgi:hypothetical protein
MNIYKGRKADTLEEATLLAVYTSELSDLQSDVVATFASTIDADGLRALAEKSIGAAVRGRYGRGANHYYDKQWFIPLPQPRYDAQPVPQITFAVQACMVVQVGVDTRDYRYRITLVDPIGKLVKVVLPISFLQAILDGVQDQFEIAGRDGRSVGWRVPGLKEPVWLPDDFLAALSATLKLTSVASWLLDFGSSGKAVFPQVVGSLLGLQSYGKTKAVPVGEQPFRRETIIEALTQMYGSAVAAEMFQRQALRLQSTMTNDEATIFILKEEGGGFRKWNTI